MVWFQCESCGENLKKPKLLNHFRGCAAQKLSCIDCGVVFDQQSVQAHTSCVSETEKYGPKDGSNGAAQKPKSSQALKAGDVDLSIGLSTSYPWNCSLCKVTATSYETLESHSQGKKHRAKAKAAHAKLSSVPVVEAASNSHGNGSQPKASAETTGSEPVEDGKLLPSVEGKEGVEDGKLLPSVEGKEEVGDGKLLPTSEADAVDLTIGLSKQEAGYPYTCSLCNVTSKSYEFIVRHSEGRKHRAKAMAAHAMLKSKADDVDLSMGISTEEAGYPYTCSLCKVTTTSYESIVRHSQAKKHRVAVVKAASNSHGNGSEPEASAETTGSELVEDEKWVPTFKSGFPWTCSLCEKPIWESVEKHEQGLKHKGKLAAIKAIGRHSLGLKGAALKKLMAGEVVEATSGAGKPKKSKAKKVAKVEVASNSDGNGSQSKASAESKGLESVEEGKEGDLKKRKAGDEREKKSGEKRTKSNKGEKLLDAAAAEEVLVSSKNGGV